MLECKRNREEVTYFLMPTVIFGLVYNKMYSLFTYFLPIFEQPKIVFEKISFFTFVYLPPNTTMLAPFG